MPAGYTDAARRLGLAAQIDRTFWIELHTTDPGDPNAAVPLTRTAALSAGGIAVGHNGYYGQWVARNGFTVEGALTTEERYSNSSDVDFGTADNDEDGNGWGTIGWITIWYDANGQATADPGQASSTAFDTHFCTMQLQTPQAVGNGDPFVIRANTIDLISRNAA